MSEIADLGPPSDQLETFRYSGVGILVQMTAVPTFETGLVAPKGHKPEFVVIGCRLDHFHSEKARNIIDQVGACPESCAYFVAHAISHGEATQRDELTIVSTVWLSGVDQGIHKKRRQDESGCNNIL